MATRKKKLQNEKLHPTAVDFVVVALVPALIIGMICGITYFLIFAFYQGNFGVRLLYLFSLFILATVLIARIAAEEGRGYASMFSIPLGIAALITINTFARVEGPLANISWGINSGLLAMIWFLADRITFDCTVIDERTQDSQQGLLQSLGMLRKEEALVSKPRVKAPSQKQKKKKPHNPGVWVMYFALLALPLFGLGQLVLPESTTAAFMCLVVYLGCALSLLAATSFLSMRRYVRQKGVEMPADVTSKWLPLSVLAIFGLLLLALVLPLPGRSLGLIGSPIKFSSGDLDTSRFGWGDEGNGDDDNEAASKTQDENGPADGAPQKDGKGNPQATDDRDAKSQQPGGSEKSNQGQQGQQSDSQQSDSQQSDSQQSDSQQSDSQQSDSQQSDAQSSESQSRSGEQQDAKRDSSSSDSQKGAESQEESSERNGENERTQQDEQKANDDQSTSPNEQGDQRGNRSGDQQEQPEENEPPSDPNSSASGSSPPPSFIPQISGSFSEMLKWITILVLAAVVLFYLITHPQEVRAMWQAFRAFLANLFGGKKRAKPKTAAPARIAPPSARRPFRDFANPFASGQSLSADKIITHTYLALQAWAEEHGTQIEDETTPAELADRLLRMHPSIGKHSQVLAQMVNRLLFAGWTPASQDVAPLEKLWQNMSAT